MLYYLYECWAKLGRRTEIFEDIKRRWGEMVRYESCLLYTSYYLPSIMGASVAVSVLWKQLFTGDGLINQLLGAEISWLGNTKTAIWVLILLSVWQFGSSMLIFLGVLKQIPQELYEAAEVDGAGPLFRFFRITLPLLTSTIFFNLVMQSINGLLVFAQGQIITAGKPCLLYTSRCV